MRFLIKLILNIIFIACICFNTNNIFASTINPILLLKSEKNINNQYEFYAFNDNNSVALYNLSKNFNYNKKWEYQFLKNKNIELLNILLGDITGNGNDELIILTYSFGENSELYVFPTNQNIPLSNPDIYSIPSLRKGAKAVNAQLIRWDKDKDLEIILNLSSPERKLLILDYIVNTIKPVNQIAEEFMTSTYGPIEFKVLDLNEDQLDDITLISNSDISEHYQFISNADNQNKTINIQGGLKDYELFKFNNNIYDLGLTANGNIYSINDDIMINNNFSFSLQDIVPINNQTCVVIENNLTVHNISINEEIKSTQSVKLPFTDNNVDYGIHPQTNSILFSGINGNNNELYLVTIKDPIIINKLNINNEEDEIKALVSDESKSIKSIIENDDYTSELMNDLPLVVHDTIYLNVLDSLELSINLNKSLFLNSLETINRPDGLSLNPKDLSFVWVPSISQAGIHYFEYIVTYNSEPILESSTTEDNEINISNKIDAIDEKHQYILYVNDIPELQLDISLDTIKFTETFTTNYEIVDSMNIRNYNLSIYDPLENNILIDKYQLYWEPSYNNYGLNQFYIEASDGMASDTSLLSIYVDTTISQIKYDENLIATVNTEFIYQLPRKSKQTTYEILEAPENLRISKSGIIHWIPIMTQIDFNTIKIEIFNDNKSEIHNMTIYVNVPPVISYRPNLNEFITQGDTFNYNLKSFDMNSDASLYWSLESGPFDLMNLSNIGKLQLITNDTIDNITYQIRLNDQINDDIFDGMIYINSNPMIISEPIDYIELGDTLAYQIEVTDSNNEVPFKPELKNSIFYSMPNYPQNAELAKSGLVTWIPTQQQIGLNNFKVAASDSLYTTYQEFSIFVNDTPNIISIDSLSILVGDTLTHLFDAKDLNRDSQLIYSIKTTIDELIFRGSVGSLTWIPTINDIGLHTLEISVSDGFNSSVDTQKLKIFVYDLPKFLNAPAPDGFVGMEYLYQPQASDMFNKSEINQDVFISYLSSIPDNSAQFDSINNQFTWLPTMNEIGEYKLEFAVKDIYNHTKLKSYDVNIIISPCETIDTLIINKMDTIQQIKTDSIFIEKVDTLIIEKIDTILLEKNQFKDKDTNNDLWRPKTFSPFINDN